MRPYRCLNELRLSGWRQFDDVAIAFHPSMTILTGQNGAGKITILHLLGRSVGWNVLLASDLSFSAKIASLAANNGGAQTSHPSSSGPSRLWGCLFA